MPNPWVSLRREQRILVYKAVNEKEQLEKGLQEEEEKKTRRLQMLFPLTGEARERAAVDRPVPVRVPAARHRHRHRRRPLPAGARLHAIPGIDPMKLHFG
jgi:hypothetical protein